MGYAPLPRFPLPVLHPMKVDSRPRLPILPFYLGIQLIQACLIALSPQRTSRIVGTTTLLAVVASVYGFTTGDAQRDYSTGNAFMTQAFTGILFIWLTEPIHEFRHERDLVAPAQLPFARRVWWALCLLSSPRGIGWSCEVCIFAPTPRLVSIHPLCRLQTHRRALAKRGGPSSGRSS